MIGRVPALPPSFGGSIATPASPPALASGGAAEPRQIAN